MRSSTALFNCWCRSLCALILTCRSLIAEDVSVGVRENVPAECSVSAIVLPLFCVSLRRPLNHVALALRRPLPLEC